MCLYELVIPSFPCRSEAMAISTTKFTETYRCLQFLEQQLNAVFKYPLAAFKSIHILAVIRCMCTVAKTNGYIRAFSLKNAIAIVVFLTVTFKALGQVYEESQEVLRQKRSLLGDKWFRRFHRSCRPLKIQVGGMYFAELGMCLTMRSFVIENVANILILSK